MARSTQEIFNSMLQEKQSMSALSALTSNSSTSIWRLILYVIAFAMNIMERLWDIYSDEVDRKIEEIIPHRPKWYRDKVLAFMANTPLVIDSDYYDISNLSDEEINKRKIVKHAVAAESNQSSLLVIKVAGETEGKRGPISVEEETQLIAYIQSIKDAGVRFSLINAEADRYTCEIDLYYDSTMSPDDVKYECEISIKDYIENLPFNGEYTNMALIDRLQLVQGVKIAELKSASCQSSNQQAYVSIDAKIIPEAGYFQAENIQINMIAYE